MSTGWGRGPGGDIGTRGTIKVVPEEAVVKNGAGSRYRRQSNQRGDSGKPKSNQRETFDMSLVPSTLAKLQRSPEHKKVSRQNVWTTSLSGKSPDDGYDSPSGIILTDVAFNRPPDLIFDSPLRSPRSSTCAPSCLPNRGGTPKKKRHQKVSFSLEPRDEPNIPRQLPDSIFGGILEVFCARFFCWKSVTSLTKSSLKVKGDEVSEGGLESIELKLSTTDSESTESEYDDVFKDSGRQELQDVITTPPSSSCSSRALIPSSRKTRSKRVSTVSTSVSAFDLQETDEEKDKLPLTAAEKRKNSLLAAQSLLDLCREKERLELLPGRYIDDMKVLHNIRRREFVAKMLYRESGQLFPRAGPPGEPNPPLPPFFLLSGKTPLPALKRDFEADPSLTTEDREKIISKIVRQKPRLDSTGEEKISPLWENSNFVQDCLRAHNLYRARHSAPPLTLSSKLCSSAQDWVNHLAQSGIYQYKCDPEIGENVFCRNVALAMKSRLAPPDITGEEVAAYWYSSVRQYRFSLPDTALHAHAGSYSQMVWKGCRDFGIGKALSRSGKIIVVAHYFPPGNITNLFRANVLPLSTRALAAEMLCQGQALLEDAMVECDEDASPLKRALMGVGTGVSGVLSAQPPNITGRNATKILAAHMLGHAASVITTSDDKLEVVVVSRKSMKKKERRKRMQESLRREKSQEASNKILFEKIREELLNSSKKAEEIRAEEEHKKLGVTQSLGDKRNPKLREMKRVKFKSEENINFCDRSKAVQTSFSSENLSTEDFSAAGLSPDKDLSSDEALSGRWTTSASSVIASSLSDSKSQSDIHYNSYTSDSHTLNSDSSPLRSCSLFIKTIGSKTNSNNSRTATSQTESEDTSRSQTHFTSSDINAYTFNPSCSTCQSPLTDVPTSSSTSNNSLTNCLTPPNTPLKCKLRRARPRLDSFGGSLDSINSLPSEATSPSGDKPFRSRGTPELNLPYGSPDVTSGILNCYALSPLPY